MKGDRSEILQAKQRLPLPELLRILGFQPPSSPDGGNMPSPFSKGQKQKTPSFSVFCKDGSWGFCDRSGGREEKGDEIVFLELLEGLSREAATKRFLSLAGLPHSEGHKKPRAKEPAIKGVQKLPDWAACVESFSPNHIERLAKWRGYSVGLCAWLKERALVGAVGDGIAFPVRNSSGDLISVHVRPKSGRWFFMPKGAGLHPLTIGDPARARVSYLFESQWDLFAAMDAMKWHLGSDQETAAFIATRGASNGKFASLACGQVVAFPQNDKAGIAWLASVASSSPGEVLSVETPSPHKDFNDWLRAGPVDIKASLTSAKPVEKPLGKETPMDKFLGKDREEKPEQKEKHRPPFDPSAAIESLGLWWLNGSASFFMPSQSGRFLEMAAAQVRTKLRVRGFRNKPDPEAGEMVSQVDRILDEATESRALDFAISLAGQKAGVYELPGGRVLVRESPRVIEPSAGDCDTILSLVQGLLGPEQADYLLCWLKCGYESLRAGKRCPGQALILVGPSDCGKSRLQHQLITPLLGGRYADPKSFFFGRTDFNAELVGSEHLLVEECPSSPKFEDRLYLGEKIKEVVANDSARLHKKNRDAMTVSPFWRISLSINDEPEKLKVLPPITNDLEEKLIVLHAKQCPEFWAQFADTSDPRAAFREAIENELPAFADLLLSMEIPERLRSRRYGVKSYLAPDIGEILFEGEPESHLLMLLDMCLWTDDKPREPWRGNAEELKQTLTMDGSPVKATATKLLNQFANCCGQYLGRLEKRFPARFTKARTGAKRDWLIQPPALS